MYEAQRAPFIVRCPSLRQLSPCRALRTSAANRGKERRRPFPVFALFCPAICPLVGRPAGARLSRFPLFISVAYGETIGAGLCPASCFFPVICRGVT